CQCLFDRIGQPRPKGGERGAATGKLQAVDDDFNMVLDFAVESEIIVEADDMAVDASAEKTALEHVLEKILIFPFLPADDGGENEEFRSLGQGEHVVDDLLARL